MFSEDNRVWWFMFGALAMMALVIYVGFYYVIPAFRGERSLLPDTAFLYENPPEFELEENHDYRAILVTNYGDVTIDLFEQNAPVNVNNFSFLATNFYYRGTQFHRLVPGFLVQGGDRNTLDDDPFNDGIGGPGYFVNDEINWDSLGFTEEKRSQLTARGYSSNPNVSSVPLRRYRIAMASAGQNTNGSQFFIIIGDDERLEDLRGRFTVIGEVVDGFDALNRIGNVPVDDQSVNAPKPLQSIVLRDVLIL